MIPSPPSVQTTQQTPHIPYPPRKIASINAISFPCSPKFAPYTILGTGLDSKILFLDVLVLDPIREDPYRGSVLIEGGKIIKVGIVPNEKELKKNLRVRVFDGRGRTLISALGDAHTHFTWNGGICIG